MSAYRKSIQEAYVWIKNNQVAATDLMNEVMFQNSDRDVAAQSVKYYIEQNITMNPTLKCMPEPFEASLNVFKALNLGTDNGRLTFDELTIKAAR